MADLKTSAILFCGLRFVPQPCAEQLKSELVRNVKKFV